MTDDNELRELGAALVEQIDALVPYIEKALGEAWDKGDYINGPQFGATVEAFRAAIATATRRAETRSRLGP